jgi:hypothetical protein
VSQNKDGFENVEETTYLIEIETGEEKTNEEGVA